MKSMLKSLMSVAAAALALTSCSNDATEEVILNGGSKTLEVNATIEETRTVMAADHVNLEWAAGDQIHLYIGDNAAEADVINHMIGDKIQATYKEGDKVYAYYSTKAGSGSDGVQKVRLNIPGTQTQSEANVFAGQNMPMVAKGTIQSGKVDLTFKPLGCVLVFNVYGPAENEKIESIKFEAAGCSGYNSAGCDLTIDPVEYTAYDKSTSATVTLTTVAPIDAAKPTDTKIGKNQVYLVVAPVSYPAGSKFIVTTDAGSTYTFETKNGIDCSQNTARVVNLNLKNAPEFKPEIIVPTVPEQSSEANNNIIIEGIKFKNIETAGLDPATVVGVYSDEALTKQDVNWLTINDNKADLFPSGKLYCNLAANETTAPRTAYIGIKCAGVQAAIAVTQVAQGSTPAAPVIVFEENFDSISVGDNTSTSGSGTKWDEYSPKFSAVTNVYKAGGAIKLGTSKKVGSITTQKLDLSAPITLEFKVKGWSKVEGDIVISVDDTEKETLSYSALMSDEFEQKSVQLDAATNASTITIATSAKRAFIDDIVIKVTK